MINIGNNKIIDILHSTVGGDNVQYRIKKGVINNSVIYDNSITSIYISSGTVGSDETHINIGDSVQYFMKIEGNDYLIKDIKYSGASIIKNSSVITFNEEGQYDVFLTYKTYTKKIRVIVSHIAFSLV